MFIVTKKIDSENISKLCRTCLREDNDKMVYLFVGPAGSSLAAKLRSLSCLEVWQGDGLPEKMCDRCITRAESALLFREQCRAADRALRQAALKVSGLTSYTTVSGCKLYQHSQGFVQLQNSQKTLKCIECGAVFVNYAELCAHNKMHTPFFQNDDNSVRHMHIVESQNLYTNLSDVNNDLTTNDLDNEVILPLIRPSNIHPLSMENTNQDRASCALQCSLCNLTFTNRIQLVNHSFSHRELSCDEEIEIGDSSDRNITYERSIDQSVENSIENLSYTREGTNSNVIQNLSFNMNMELGPSQDESLNNSVLKVKEPESSVLSVETDKQNKYKCDECHRSFSQKSKLASHKLSHNGEKPFECIRCDKSYSSKSKLSAHMKLHTRMNVNQCKICSKIFSYPSYLTDHMKTHQPKTSEKDSFFDCPVCKKRFQTSKAFKRHSKVHTGKGLFQCDICDKIFDQKYTLKIHLQLHRPTRIHKCDYCDKSFNQKSNLVDHMRVHTKMKPFKCNTCGKHFAQSSHLKSHEASHDSVRQHQCRLCGKRFKLASHLKRHLNLHSGSKVYKCDQCDQMFSQAFSLKRHSKRHNENHL